jgi:hypothetical protein
MTNSGFKSIGIFLMLAAVSTFLALGLLSSPVKAQPGEDPNYKYPILQEKDFQLFLKLMDSIPQNKSAQAFFIENNVTEEYTQAVVAKITTNTMAKLQNSEADLEKELGSSIMFTPAENKLYKKYENRIVTALKEFALSQ